MSKWYQTIKIRWNKRIAFVVRARIDCWISLAVTQHLSNSTWKTVVYMWIYGFARQLIGMCKQAFSNWLVIKETMASQFTKIVGVCEFDEWWFIGRPAANFGQNATQNVVKWKRTENKMIDNRFVLGDFEMVWIVGTKMKAMNARPRKKLYATTITTKESNNFCIEKRYS